MLTALPLVSHASEPTWLSWRAPPECPDPSYIQSKVTDWLEGPLPGPERLSVDGATHWTGERWRVSVNVALDGRPGRREVEVDRCSDAADFVALTVVLAVNPESALGEPAPTDAEAATPAESASEAPEQGAAAQATAEQAMVEQAMVEQAEPASEPTRASSPKPDGGPRWSVALAPELAAGVLPGARFGVGLFAGLGLGRLETQLGVRWLPPGSDVPANAAAPISYSLLGARATAAYLWPTGALALGPLVAFEVGAIFSDQEGDGGQERALVTTPWFGAGAGALAEIAFSPQTFLRVSGELAIPLTQTYLRLDDGQLAHAPAIGARTELGVRFLFDRP